MGFWNQDHQLSKELDRLWDKYVPASGATEYVETELLRAANRIIYDWYNNGWMNNKTGELEFLQDHDLFTEISNEDLAAENGDTFEEYMDNELAAIIELVLEAEKSDTFSPLEGDPLSKLGLSSREWDDFKYDAEDEDEYDRSYYYDDDDDDDEEGDE
jgi:hypothetical protein